MPTTPERAARLRAGLARRALTIEDIECDVGVAAVPSYPGGARPTSEVRLRGRGATGRGECVAWTAEAHAAFRLRVAALPRGRFTTPAWGATIAARIPDPYERAALEAAALDLALRQAGTNLARLAGAAPAPVRYVVSFGRLADPLEAIRGEAPGVELKLDVDPAWDDATWAALGALGRVAVLDFKGGGTVADHERAHRAVPAALLEDPRPGDRSWSPSLRARVSVDGPLTSAAVLARFPLRPAAASVKPARMGGVLAALDLVAACATAGIPVYLGGMFEVGVGRRQLHALAALLSPDGPNDVAPLAVGTQPAARPARITVDAEAPGFA